MNNQDFVKELDYLGFTMRLKRISDAMIQDGRRLYKELDVSIEPNWYVVFKLLKKEGSLSVTQIAERLLLAHPSVITITNKMLDNGYLNSRKSDEDNRKRVLELSNKAKNELPVFESIWEAGTSAMEKALIDIKGLEFLEVLENRFFDKGFKERTLNEIKSRKLKQ